MPNISKYCSIFERCSLMYKNNNLNEYGICGAHVIYFFFLNRNPGATQEEISKNLFLNKSNVARSLQYLEQNDFIYREIDKDDKRINHVYLTEKGISLVPIIREKISEFNKIVSNGFTEEELTKLDEMLYRLASNAVTYSKKTTLGEDK